MDSRATLPATESASFHRIDSHHDVRELIHAAWSRCSHLTGRDLSFIVRGEEIVLQGMVRSYFQKQLAQETLKTTGLGHQILNQIEVI